MRFMTSLQFIDIEKNRSAKLLRNSNYLNRFNRRILQVEDEIGQLFERLASGVV